MFFFTLIVLSLSSSVDVESLQIDSPCLTELRAESLKFIGQKGPAGSKSVIYKECYAGIPDKNKVVTSLSTNTRCYFAHNSFYQSFGGINFARCGICLELIGPSKRTVCTSVGSVIMQPTSVAEMQAYARTIFMDEELFTFIAGIPSGMNTGYAIPIATRITNCPYQNLPFAVATKIIDDTLTHTSIASIAVFNTNVVVKKILYNTTEVIQNNVTLKFDVMYNKSNYVNFIKAYDMFGVSIKIPFNFIENKTQPAMTPFSGKHLKSSKCYLRLHDNILNTSTSGDPLMAWITTYKVSLDSLDVKVLTLENNNFTFDSETTLIVSFPFPIVLSNYYSSLLSVFSVSEKVINLKIERFAKYPNADEEKRVSCVNEDLKIANSTTENGTNHYSGYVSMKRAKCLSPINIIKFTLNTGKLNSHLIVHQLEFRPFSETNFTQCTLAAFVCLPEDQCDPTNSEIDADDGEVKTYQEGCVPYCGVCHLGETCNKNARCVKSIIVKPNSTTTLSIILSFCIFFFF
ncbi:hypothetical protein EIN_096990 [Entamoeba invadens IP1]|uniref:Uncharacterized protein n=1 Tax=Entamoeba invadens IP1 TaxID=370355 RepID=A0A0A1U0N4_ENTIV|nr:hypothetical protein EIN_096990 [Entamoeba invadens IP1]ELP87432.1 hypothetical protein EIN_096990 [Entamoeba invadens IP1]|eukprot:XP_004254203.1 hypothetical protein EIN_096990 [Entamoeba invadens IP1]